MKNHKAVIIIMFLALAFGAVNAQTINWANLNGETRHIVNASLGLEYGAVYGLGYGFQTRIGPFPLLANAGFSFPAGDQRLDDFKTNIGVQIRWIESGNFQVSTKLHGVFRRYENDLVRLLNFGSDMSAIVGYYRPKWFVAGEAGFDKAIVTHFQSKDYRDQYPGVVDGWYEPSTGGNFYYGLQVGFSFMKNDLFLRAGKMVSQDFKTAPLLPYYGQLGYNLRF